MKALTLIFVVLIALLQYPLWLGKGSWLRVWDLSHQLAQQQEKNNALKARNDTLDAEVRDLKSGRAAIEERARSELGMVKQDEVFYQVLEGPLPVIAPPVVTPEVSPKTDTPIVVKVPNKNATATPSSPHKSAVSPGAVPSSSTPKEIAPKARISKDNAPKDESTKEKSPVSSQPTEPSPQIETNPTKNINEKTKTEEKPKKVKPAGNDAVEAAKAVLKQQ